MIKNSMQAICADFRDGRLSHTAQDDIFKQLSVEGKRRIDAFVFELAFKGRMQTIVRNQDLTLSFGWHLGYNKYGEAAYWFRLMNAGECWNFCDEALTLRLQKPQVGGDTRRPKIFKVECSDNNDLVASERLDAAWKRPETLEAALERLAGSKNKHPPRSMDNVDPQSAEAAFRWLRKRGFCEELAALSIQRRFMNCILGPCLGRDGTDLDVMVLTSGGDLRCVEFKRKYPATGKHKFFGLDTFPHRKTIETVKALGVSALHIILVPPRWGKSPITWLDDSTMNEGWTWLAVNLDHEPFEQGIELQTQGADSGQRSQTRKQVALKWKCVKLLHEGLRLGPEGSKRMIEFLQAGSLKEAKPVTYEILDCRRAK